ncbi:OprD family porin [Sulfurimonas sp.]|nr:OprD family porin [Sulfurimonas sp.]
MKKIVLNILLLVASMQASDSMETWLEDGKVNGNLRYYYIETQIDRPNGVDSSAHANAIGGQLGYTTGSLNGFRLGATFMTTLGFALPNVVDASNIGRDNGVRKTGSASGNIAQDGFSVIGEAFIEYKFKDLTTTYGRKVIKTPLIHAKDVRMLPSAVQGLFFDYKLNNNVKLGASYLTHFKQRTSDRYTNIIEHVLGDDTKTVTGSKSGEVIVASATYNDDNIDAKLYNYYADDFMNAVYVSLGFKNKISDNLSYKFDTQYIGQRSIGHADDYMSTAGSITGGKEIDANLLAAKIGFNYKESGLSFAFSKVFSDSDKHDSLVTPWDGTPLLTNMITSNSLFVSNYGQGLKADSVYIGGSRGVKVAYTQKYDFTGVKGFKSSLAYLHIDNNNFAKNEDNYNAVVAYSYKKYSLALKGIWVNHASSSAADGTVSQHDKLIQYRVIGNYRF